MVVTVIEISEFKLSAGTFRPSHSIDRFKTITSKTNMDALVILTTESVKTTNVACEINGHIGTIKYRINTSTV